MSDEELLQMHRQELRRGTTVLACLTVLRTPEYGYALLDRLADFGLTVEGNTLYPLLRRLEKQGLLTSEWNTTEARPRKFYVISPAGEQVLSELREDWDTLNASLNRIEKGQGS